MYTTGNENSHATAALLASFSDAERPVLGAALDDYQHFAAAVIGDLPMDQVLSRNNKAVFLKEASRELNPGSISAPKLVVVVKATRLCNLRCTYCHSWAEGPGNSMSFETLARSIRELLAIPNIKRFEFVWHGGEVTVLKPAFFKKMIWLQQQFKRPDQLINNSIQSNAVDISDEWLEFLRGTGMSVGISADGIPEVHDKRRIDKLGKPTSGRVVSGIQRFKDYDIPYGALVVVDKAVSEMDPRDLFEYFDLIDLRYIDFLNIVPDNRVLSTDKLDTGYISYAEFIAYLTRAFPIWWKDYRDKIDIAWFKDFVRVLGDSEKPLAACYWASGCSQEVITLEANGDVSPCDKYVGDIDSNYGSLLENSLEKLLKNSNHNRISIEEERLSTERMKSCKWFSICHGGCPHDRIINRRHVAGYDDTCCGTGDLLQTMSNLVYGGKRKLPSLIASIS